MRRLRQIHWRRAAAGILALLCLPLWPSPHSRADSDVSSPHYQAAVKKIQSIATGRAAPGSRVFLSRAELDAYLRSEAKNFEKRGITEVRIESIGQNSAVASARMDVVELNGHLGSPLPSLLERLLGGKRPVRLSGRVKSSQGTATVNIEFVEVSGIAMPGRVFEYLASSVTLKEYPDVHLGEPFELGYDIERIQLAPDGVTVYIGAKKSASR